MSLVFNKCKRSSGINNSWMSLEQNYFNTNEDLMHSFKLKDVPDLPSE